MRKTLIAAATFAALMTTAHADHVMMTTPACLDPVEIESSLAMLRAGKSGEIGTCIVVTPQDDVTYARTWNALGVDQVVVKGETRFIVQGFLKQQQQDWRAIYRSIDTSGAEKRDLETLTEENRAYHRPRE